MNYENLSFDDLRKLLLEDEEKFKEIPIEYIRSIVAEEAIKRNTVHIDDSSITFKEEYPYQKTPEKQFIEVLPFSEGKKIKIYLKEKNRKYVETPIVFASHLLEQVFDKDNQLVSEELKEL